MTRFRRALAFTAVVAMLVLAISQADARPGFGGSFGSRGTRTFTPPPVTRTAPNAAAPIERTITQPARPSPGVTQRPPASPGFFNRPGILGGLMAGFLGAGLFGLLFGHGLFGGLAGLSGMIGLLLQIALIGIVGWLIFAWWQRRNAFATAGGPSLDGAQAYSHASMPGGFGGQGSAPPPPVTIMQADYDAFERLLQDITLTYAAADLGRLRAMVTPEMLSDMAGELSDYVSRGLVNETSGIKLLQGDLSEAWQEDDGEYATVAIRYSLTDALIESASGRIVEGSRSPQEVSEIWTFYRARGGQWLLSAVQQTE
jgi:predicted lipid-binding transport protein (Tim44 family)